MGEAWHRAIYFFAGFRAGPFHAADLALLLANILLVYSVARRLAESRFAALTAALLFAYQQRWAALYFDTGYIYDVLCGFFLFASLLMYIRVRQSGRMPPPIEYATVAALFVCALNSKEMAVALPVAVLLYEVVFERRRHLVTAAVMSAVTIVYIAGRTGQLTGNPAYRPQFTFARFTETSAHFLDELFAANDWFTVAGTLAFVAGLLLFALIVRSKPLIYAWAFTAASALPIAFVPPRGGPQYYIPLFGCALYAGCLAALAANRLGRVWAPNFWMERAAAAAALIAIAWPIYSHGKFVALRGITSITEESPVVMSLAARLRQLHPALPTNARLLFLNDPIAPNLEDLLFIVRLVYRNRTIEVERVSRTHSPPTSRQMQAYDAVFDYDAYGLTEVRQPALALEPRILRFFDAEWKPITAAYAAKRGSRIIAFAKDLGPTRPEVAGGEPFPRDPLATALLRLSVTVNERPATVVGQLGNPGEVNIYRFDFILPTATEPGLAKVKISAAGAISPAAEIPVAH